MTTSDLTPEDLDDLAASLRADLPLRSALIDWGGRLFGSTRSAIAGRVVLGAEVEAAFAGFGSVAASTAAVLAPLASHGGDAAMAVRTVAESVRRARAQAATAAASVAGVRLSSRMIAWLPLVALPFLFPLLVRLRGDAVVLLAVAAGGVLTVTGSRWIQSMLPSETPSMPSAATFCCVFEALVSGGLHPGTAVLHAVAGVGDELSDVVHRIRLGEWWCDALASSSNADVAELGRRLRHAARTGVPLQATVQRFTQELGERDEAAFERDVRRAPVRMIVPLTLCVLPGFVLASVVPLLRALSVTS